MSNNLFKIETSFNEEQMENLKKEVYFISEFAKKTYLHNLKSDYELYNKFGKGSITSKLWEYYNIFNFKQPILKILFEKLKNFFIQSYSPKTNYYISSWINIHKKTEFLEWHGHWPPELNTYHGYFALQSEPSTTTYKFPNEEDLYIHTNKNGLLLINKSDGDHHCVSEWNEDYDRLSIAFDIVLIEHIEDHWKYDNYFIPFI